MNSEKEVAKTNNGVNGGTTLQEMVPEIELTPMDLANFEVAAHMARMRQCGVSVTLQVKYNNPIN